MNSSSDHKIYGSVTVNAKGQIVIPVDAREKLNIKPGDHLVVTSKGSLAVGLIKADNMQEFVAAIKQEHPECFKNIEKDFIDYQSQSE